MPHAPPCGEQEQGQGEKRPPPPPPSPPAGPIPGGSRAERSRAEAREPQGQRPRPRQPRGRSSPEPPRLSPARRTGAAAEPLSPPALGVSFIPGPAGLTGFSGTQTAVVNEIRSPQITDLCRTL